MIQFWQTNLDTFRIYSKPAYCRLITNIRADAIKMLISLPKFSSSILNTEVNVQAQADISHLLRRCDKKTAFYMLHQESGINGRDGNSYVTNTAKLDRTSATGST